LVFDARRLEVLQNFRRRLLEFFVGTDERAYREEDSAKKGEERE
jgi:hypothetical protein